MSSSLVSGPYASAVSIKFTPSSTARRNTLSALPRSGGQPQTPSPVMRIAPKPSRLTARSPPNFQTEFVARFGLVDEAAPKIVADPPANSVAPLARLIPRNVRRVIPLSTRFRFALGDLSGMTRKYVHGNRSQCKRAVLSVAAAVSAATGSDSRVGSLSFMTSTAVRFNDVALQQITLIFSFAVPFPPIPAHFSPSRSV